MRRPKTDAKQYSDLALYNQLRYFASLFDESKILKGATGSSKDGMWSQLVSCDEDLNQRFLSGSNREPERGFLERNAGDCGEVHRLLRAPVG